MAHFAMCPRFPPRNLDDYFYERAEKRKRLNDLNPHNIRIVEPQVKPPGVIQLSRKKDDMTELTPSASIPPHLRRKKQKSTANGTVGVSTAKAVQPTGTATDTPPATNQKTANHSTQRPSAPSPAPPITGPPNKVIDNGKPGVGSIKASSSKVAKDVNGSRGFTGAVDGTKDDVGGGVTGAEHSTAGNVDWYAVQPAQASKGTNSRGPRKNTKHKYVWPKQRDMKPAPSDDESDGGIDWKSDSNGDPNYDVAKLVGWNGDWMPPPVEWSARHPFVHRHFGNHIETWINSHDSSCTQDITNLLKSLNFTGTKVDEEPGRIVTQDVVPRSWVPGTIEGEPPQAFWRAFPSRAPRALSDIDLSEREPFWTTYPKDGKFCFIPPPEVPTALLDPNDPENKNPRAGISAMDFIEQYNKQKMEKMRRLQERKNRPVSLSPAYVLGPPQLSPKANVYLRPVDAGDAEGIQEIYNWYIANSCSLPEFLPRGVDQVLNRMNEITSSKLPYLVAVDRGNRQRTQGRRYVTDKIVGYALLDEFCHKGSMWRYTMEMEFYVHHQYTSKGIAKCLIDRLLSTVSPAYPVKGGYEYVNRGEYLKTGAARVVKTILLSVPHAHTDDMGWMTKLMKGFEFSKTGHLKQMGAKYDKIVDMTLYQHITQETINPADKPTNPW